MPYKYALKFLIKAKFSSFLFYAFFGFILLMLALFLPWGGVEIVIKTLFLLLSFSLLRNAYFNTQILQINGQELTRQYFWTKGQKENFQTHQIEKIENSSPLYQAKYAYGVQYNQLDTYSSTIYFKDGRKIHLYSSFENYAALLNYLRLDIENLNEEESYTLLDQIKEKIDTLFD
jgi:hypothetical protein